MGARPPSSTDSLAVSLGTNRWLDPPESPRFFAATEGPALPFGDTVPSSALAVYNVAGALLWWPRTHPRAGTISKATEKRP